MSSNGIHEAVRSRTGTVICEARGLRKSYFDNEVLKGVDLRINRGEVQALIGPSGSGKSTILRLLALLENADGGEIVLHGDRIGVHTGGRNIGRPLRERQLARQRRPFGMVFQQFNLFPHLTAVENVQLGLMRVRGMSRSDAAEKAARMLDRVGMIDRANGYPAELSGGQQQRVAIARALVMDPEIMLFDEPTSALDPELVREVLEVIEQLAAEGMTMLVVTHEMAFARRVADTVHMFHSGTIVESGAPGDIMDRPENEHTRRFLHI